MPERLWIRAVMAMRCGRCGQPIDIDQPLLLLPVGKNGKARCVACEGPAPPDLPRLVERCGAAAPLTMTPLHAIAGLLDVNARPIGEREPGEDG